MYKLIQYYLYKDEIRFHIVTIVDTEGEMNKFKKELAEWYRKADIKTYEIIATKNINSLKKVLQQEDVFYFRVISD